MSHTTRQLLDAFHCIRNCLNSPHFLMGTGVPPNDLFDVIKDSNLAFRAWKGESNENSDEWIDWHLIREGMEVVANKIQFACDISQESRKIHQCVRSVLECLSITRINQIASCISGTVRIDVNDRMDDGEISSWHLELETADWISVTVLNDICMCFQSMIYSNSVNSKYVNLILDVYAHGGVPSGWKGLTPDECDGRIDGGDGTGGLIAFWPSW